MQKADGTPGRQRLYREVNLRILEVTASLESSEETVELLCECGREDCDFRLPAELTESQALLGEAQVLLVDHRHRDGHRVVAEHPTFIVAVASPELDS